jgi:hypothetical protein
MEIYLESFRTIIEEIVNNISLNNYKAIEDKGQNGKVDIKDLERVIKEYGCTIIPLPEKAFSKAEVYKMKDESRLDVYIPLWTEEEGRSDLTLSLSCYYNGNNNKVEINDLEVL